MPHPSDFPEGPPPPVPSPSAPYVERLDVAPTDGGWSISDDGRVLLACSTEEDARLARDLLGAALAMHEAPIYAAHLGALKDAVAAIQER